MTKEDKMLLIRDLSSRLPYAVTVEHTSGFRGTLHDIAVHHMYDENDNVYDAICYTDFFGDEDSIYIEFFKPYLFPLSSMTEKQKKEQEAHFTCIKHDMSLSICRYMEWCYKNHLDINGLLSKGLAIDATGLNIY